MHTMNNDESLVIRDCGYLKNKSVFFRKCFRILFTIQEISYLFILRMGNSNNCIISTQSSYIHKEKWNGWRP